MYLVGYTESLDEAIVPASEVWIVYIVAGRSSTPHRTLAISLLLFILDIT